MLHQQFNINYNNLPKIFRWGSCVLLMEVEAIVKYDKDGCPITRLKKQISTVHSQDIARRTFWNQKPSLVKELGSFVEDIKRIDKDYVKYFQSKNKLMPYTWGVIRIDGSHFHKFADVHNFEKPNDEQALKLMNECAVGVLDAFREFIFSYGVSDEYSFILKRSSHLQRTHASDIVSSVVSFFTSMYVMKWKAFFPLTDLVCQPSFDGRVVCYPSTDILRDYLSWRQVDCHINNQYNTCFWMLVKSGKSRSEAQQILKGTQSQEKMELLANNFGIDYNAIGEKLRLGSSAFWEEETGCSKIVVQHCNIIDGGFWEAHPYILA
ncbi:unnamed protein product [Linum tenue]|nr:unnamed protein product [Linum tenue]